MKAIIQLSDDFEKGYCSECPFSYEEYVEYDEDEGYLCDWYSRCVLGYNFQDCKLEIVEADK